MPEPIADTSKDVLTGRIIEGALAVHRALGPGLLESAYESCLTLELTASGLRVIRQLPVPIRYRGQSVGVGYRVDLLIEREVVVEIKSVNRLPPIAEAQALTYLKLLGLRRALILNFNVTLLRDGITRLVR
jgi:GxxExxY protein